MQTCLHFLTLVSHDRFSRLSLENSLPPRCFFLLLKIGQTLSGFCENSTDSVCLIDVLKGYSIKYIKAVMPHILAWVTDEIIESYLKNTFYADCKQLPSICLSNARLRTACFLRFDTDFQADHMK